MNIAAFPKYEHYRDTGSDWIEELPSHWEVQPVRANFAFRNEKNDPVVTEDILSLSIANGVTLYNEEGRGGNKRKDDLTAYKIARPDDIVLNSMNVIVGAVGRSKYFGAISPVYYAMYATKPNTNISYYDRVFANSAFQKGLLRHGKGILMKLSGTGQLNTIRMKISQSDLKNVLLPSPPPDEQKAIVSFLDGKCAKIDEAVRIKEEQIKLLAERRQILIQQAVTRGLNPDASMKHSGIDWIGQIPAQWEVKRNFVLFREIKAPGSAELPVLSVSIHSGVSKGELSDEENIRSIIKIADRSFYKEVLPGDIAYNMMRAWQGGIGAVHTHGMVSPAYVVSRPVGSLTADYFELLYRTPAFIWQMDASSKGITDFRKRLYWDDFRDLMTIVPPKTEQEQIIEYATELSEKIDNSISIKEDQISALKEYKTSLINAAVTGKIKVI